MSNKKYAKRMKRYQDSSANYHSDGGLMKARIHPAKVVKVKIDEEAKLLYLIRDGVIEETFDLIELRNTEIEELKNYLPTWLGSVFRTVIVDDNY